MTQSSISVTHHPDAAASSTGEAEIRYYTASQFQLMWWKFRKHKLALLGSTVLGVFVIIATFAEFLSPYSPTVRTPEYLFGRPQVLHFVDVDGEFHLRPFTYSLMAGPHWKNQY